MSRALRTGLFVVAVLALILLAIVVVLAMPTRPGLPAGCEAALDAYKYVGYEKATGGTGLNVKAVRRAARPEHMTGEMSRVSLGDSVHYETDVKYDAQENDAGEPDLLGSKSGLMPLPYPPNQVWCALVERRTGAEGAETERGVVFAALHEDIYNADWVVHQAADSPFSPRSFDAAAAIGCELEKLEQ